jgi:hypothetical protein
MGASNNKRPVLKRSTNMYKQMTHVQTILTRVHSVRKINIQAVTVSIQPYREIKILVFEKVAVI